MQNRPFIKSNIQFLEAEYEKKKSDPNFLNDLLKELGYRKTPRAIKLKLTITENGEKRNIELGEAIALKICRQAAEGDLASYRVVIEAQSKMESEENAKEERNDAKKEWEDVIVGLGKRTIEEKRQIDRIAKALKPMPGEKKSYDKYKKEFDDKKSPDAI